MKKKILVYIIATLCLLLSSCSLEGLFDEEPPESDLVIPLGVEPNLIFNDREDEDFLELIGSLDEAVTDRMDCIPFFGSDATDVGEHEIVVGKSTRQIALAAEALLSEKLDADKENGINDSVGYAVYAKDGSVAVVWSHDSMRQLAFSAIISAVKAEGIDLRDGDIIMETFSYSAYLDEHAESVVANAWQALYDNLPEDTRDGIIAELKALYTMYSSDAIVWTANLYDPATGGFYCSNSARDDTKGFWNGSEFVQYQPDVESTWAALDFLKTTGAAELYDNDWVKALPDWVKERTADWVYSLQDEDGFFYHPQWPKEYVKRYESRMTRDRNSALTLLDLLGKEPKYSKSYLQNPLTGSLGQSSAAMVSKLVAASSTLPQYQSDEAFGEYLAQLDKTVANLTDAERAYKFYEYGNKFQATTGDMTDNMKAMLVEFFDKHQNPENGMWSEGLYFNSTNGIHKIAAVYNAIGAELKYVDKIVESTIKVLSFDPNEVPAVHVVDMYNAWSCFPYIYKNIRNFSEGTPEEREARCNEIKEAVFENAVSMIRISRKNLESFRYPDGSFGYNTAAVGSSGTNQGCPASVPGAKEGDLNGTGIAMVSLSGCIFGALEMNDYKVPIYTERERLMFIEIITEIDQKYQESLKQGSN